MVTVSWVPSVDADETLFFVDVTIPNHTRTDWVQCLQNAKTAGELPVLVQPPPAHNNEFAALVQAATRLEFPRMIVYTDLLSVPANLLTLLVHHPIEVMVNMNVFGSTGAVEGNLRPNERLVLGNLEYLVSQLQIPCTVQLWTFCCPEEATALEQALCKCGLSEDSIKRVDMFG